MPDEDLTTADAAATLAAEEEDERAVREVEVRRMRRMLHFCDLNSIDPQTQPGAVPKSRGGDRLIQIGGDGTPLVADLCLAEYAIARRTGVMATQNFAAACLDLRHRLPHLWAAVQAYEVPAWAACRIANLSRKLTKDQVTVVDIAVAAAAHESVPRLLDIAEAKIIEADPDGHRQRLTDQAKRKGVWMPKPRPGQQIDEVDGTPGVQRLTARLDPGDAGDLDQTIDDVADALTENHQPLDEEDVPTRDQFRAQALALLADPHTAVRFLDGLQDGSGDPGPPAAPPAPEPTGPEPQPPVRKPRKRPATINVHLHHDVLTGRTPGIARVEELGPMLLEQIADLLKHRDVTVTPVIDLNTGGSVNGYEHPTAVKRRTLLRTIGDVFPHSPNSGLRRLDHDHPTPYQPGGPPGQTGDHNDAPLTRRHHRVKTHHPYQVDQLGYGVYRWITPHGLGRLVTPTGTRTIEPIRGPDGTVLGEIYPGPPIKFDFTPRE